MSLKQRVEVTFSSEEFTTHYKSDLFDVTGFEGIEAISEPFRFDLDLISDESKVDLTLLVGKTATLEIVRDANVRKIHGVILSMAQGEEVQFNQYSYKAVLVPRLHLLSLSRQNQIYQEKTVPQIVTHEILEGEFSGGITSDDIDSTRLAAAYPEREYVVQYNETDLSFISRLMEHEGIYYYFDHDAEQEKLVLCDNESDLDTLIEENTVPYVPASGMATFEDEAIHSFCFEQRQITSQIILKDFNYRQPHITLQGDAETCDLGYGRVCHYGDHFKDPMEGDKLAKMRAEVELCKLKTFSGKSDAILFQAGKLFVMQDHFRAELNNEYLITRIHHRGGQALPGVSGVAVSGEAIAYQNEFDAIPSDIEFRPVLKTPKPKLYGILNGTIDGALNTDRAQIDDQGRYKLLMPFDLSGTAEGKASRWVRKAESYGGQGTGMHFPLLKGTEVIWTCIDGDPDRPIIIGVVSNPLNKSVVSSANSNRNMIKTPGGTVMIMDDGGSASGGGSSSSSEQQQTRKVANETPRYSSVFKHEKHELIQQQPEVVKTVNSKEGVADSLSCGQKMYSMLVQNYNNAGDDSYFRMGYPDKSFWEREAGTAGGDGGEGILMATDGSIKQKSYKNFFSQTSGISFKQDTGMSGTYNRTYSAGLKASGSTNVNATYDLTMGFGTSTKFTVGADVSVNYGIKFSSGATLEYKNISGALIQQANEILIRASTYNKKSDALDMALGGGTVAAGLAAAATTIAAVPTELGTWSNSDINENLLIASELTSASAVAGSIAYALKKIMHEKAELKSNGGKESYIAMDSDSLVLHCDGSSIVINGEGIFINGKTIATGQLPKNADSFCPNAGDLKTVNVGKIFPEYINLNAVKRVDIRSQENIFIASNPKFKMVDNLPVAVDPKKRTLQVMPPPPPNKGARLHLDKMGNIKSYAETDFILTSKTKFEIDARGTMDVTTKNALYSQDITATGFIKDKNLTSS